MRLTSALVLAITAATAATALGLAACNPAPTATSPRPSASEAVDVLGDHYAELELMADSVGAAQAGIAEEEGPSELAQVTARNLAGRIRSLYPDYSTVSLAMTAADYERGVSLWMRLSLAQAALELLEEDATRLGEDPDTGPAEVHHLADQLSGALELGRVTGRVAARTFAGATGR
jgi:hypothetical protein